MADAKRQTSPSLGDDLDEAKIVDRRCGIAKIFDEISDEDREKLVATIDNALVSPSDIARILQKHGLDVSEKMVYRHRNRGRGGCRCPQ